MKINSFLKTLMMLLTIASSIQTIQAQFCAGLTNLTALNGTITDGSGSSNYANNSNCSWLIQPPGNPANITFTMDSINLSGNIDAVRVYDGTSTAGTLVAIFRGNNLGSAVIANSGSMFVQFTSNGFGNAQGWAASYTSASTNCQPNTVITANNGDFTDGTRNGSNYANNTNCEWLIQPTAPGVFVEVAFSRFAVAGGDSLILYDGINASAPILAVLSGNNNPATIQSSGSDLFVRFVTNAIGTANGWRIVYNTQPIPFCSGLTTLNSPAGLFNDGSFPFSNYVQNSNCSWLIAPPGAVTVDLQFNYFSTEANFDFVTVYQGTNNNGVLLGSFSGNRVPPTLTSATGAMYIEFNTDNLVNSTGWEGSYTSSNTAIITAAVDTIYLNAGAGSTTSFQLTANASWTTTDNQGWLISSPVNGIGNQTINLLAIQANIGPERTAELYINAAAGSGGDTVIVIQRSSGRFLDIPTDTLFFAARNAAIQSFNLLANVPWSNNISDPWISLNPSNGSNNSSPQVSVANNPTNQIRTGYIVVLGTQNAGNDTIFIQQDSLLQNFSVSPDSIVLNSTAGSKDSVQVNSNINWVVSNTSNWLSTNVTSGNDSATVTITTNSSPPTIADRSAYVYFNSVNGTLVDSVLVRQIGIPPFLVGSPDSVLLNMGVGEIATFNISASNNWTINSAANWLVLSQQNGSGNDVITASTASINMSNNARTGLLYLEDIANNLKDTLTVIQGSATGIISVNPSNLSLASTNGSSAIFLINSDVNWSITGTPSWLNLSTLSGINNGTVTATANSANLSGSDRVATLLISGLGAVSKTITVTQVDANSNAFLLSVDTLFVGSTNGSVADFTVISNSNWSLTESTSWLALNKTNGITTEVVTARAGSANLFGSPRFATVTASSAGKPDQTLVVVQLGTTLSFSYAPDSLIIGADSASFGKFNITSNLLNWNASTTESWLRVSPTNGTLTAEITVTSTKPNSTGLLRSGTVTISSAPFIPLVAKVVQDTVRSIGIKERTIEQQVSIFPNPSTGLLNVKFDSNVDPSTTAIEVFDIVGKTVSYEVNVVSREHLLLNLSGLNKGFYIVKINVEQESFSKKILLLPD